MEHLDVCTNQENCIVLLHVENAQLIDDMLEMIIYCAGQTFADRQC